MNELVKALDAIGEKEWFRQQMGMKRLVVCHYLIRVFLLLCVLARIHSERKHETF